MKQVLPWCGRRELGRVGLETLYHSVKAGLVKERDRIPLCVSVGQDTMRGAHIEAIHPSFEHVTQVDYKAWGFEGTSIH
jgi:hypothetical protein